ncbi:MAG: hypothetical protein PVG83_01300 [Acidimicrobiia bacterium]
MGTKRGRHERIECRHRKKKVSETAGLRRTVCPRCKTVTVTFVHDVFAEEKRQLRNLAT